MNSLSFSDIAPLAVPGFGNAWVPMAYHFLPMPIMWITGIGRSAKEGESCGGGGIGPWIPWVALYLLSLFTPMRASGYWLAGGASLAVIGLVLYTSAIFSFLRSRAGDRLISDGLYRFSRHPIYITQAVFMAGMCIMTASLPFILISLYVTIQQLRSAAEEETICAARLGEAYRRYSDRTPRWMGFPRKGGG